MMVEQPLLAGTKRRCRGNALASLGWKLAQNLDRKTGVDGGEQISDGLVRLASELHHGTAGIGTQHHIEQIAIHAGVHTSANGIASM